MSGNIKDDTLHTTDARVWAREFCRLNTASDEGMMLGWFANAIETGRDAGMRMFRDLNGSTEGEAQERLRRLTQRMVEVVGADGPCSAEDALDRLLELLDRYRLHNSIRLAGKANDPFAPVDELTASIAGLVNAEPMSEAPDVLGNISGDPWKDVDVALGFALCHSDFSSTRNAIKGIRRKIAALRGESVAEPITFSDGTPVPYVVVHNGKVVARCANKADADLISRALAPLQR